MLIIMATDAWLNTFALVAAWLCYFTVHSVLASLSVKRWVAARWPGFMQAYRLTFNALALLLLLPIFWMMAANPWPLVWQWQGLGKAAANTLSILALLGFIWSLQYYDLQEFLGLRQWRGHITAPEDQEHLQISVLHRFVRHPPEDQEHLQISVLHRFVRHPWYCFAIVLLWSRDMNLAQFVFSVMASVYFTIGSRLEERRLLVYYGERYRSYMQRVPGLFPLPWKFINAAEARRIGGE